MTSTDARATGINGQRLGEIKALLQEELRGRLHNFQLTLRGECLVLEGSAPSYYAKQLAQHAVMRAADSEVVLNQLVVTYPQ